MPKFTKKPITIVAEQFDGTELSADLIIDWITDNRGAAWKIHRVPGRTEFVIGTLEGNMEVSVGDYVIKGVKGEFYPCKPDIFAETYDG